jgi:ABC-type phosphate transport system permease subunit
MFLVGGLAVGVGLAALVGGYQAHGRIDTVRSLPSIVIGLIVIGMAAQRLKASGDGRISGGNRRDIR